MRNVIVIAHNLRSCQNVGSLLRTAEGLGAQRVYLTGYTPYPAAQHDSRLPHIAAKMQRQITKTALGAEHMVAWEHRETVIEVIKYLREQGYTIAALEQAPRSLSLPDYHPPERIAIILGREVEGIEPEVVAQCDIALEIPMNGKKESFNVVQAAAMALYHCTYYP